MSDTARWKCHAAMERQCRVARRIRHSFAARSRPCRGDTAQIVPTGAPTCSGSHRGRRWLR
eukprot:9334772-Pyramimonas_sp.AAC.1